jgi:hypothetical protein
MNSIHALVYLKPIIYSSPVLAKTIKLRQNKVK